MTGVEEGERQCLIGSSGGDVGLEINRVSWLLPKVGAAVLMAGF